MKTRLALAAFTALVLVAGACSTSAADMTDAELREALTEVFTADDGITETQATCVIDYLFDNTTRDDLNRIADADEVEDLDESDLDLVFDAVFECL